VRLVPNERVVEVMEFETANETMRGEMRVTFRLAAFVEMGDTRRAGCS
jgi:hypothetical protein